MDGRETEVCLAFVFKLSRMEGATRESVRSSFPHRNFKRHILKDTTRPLDGTRKLPSLDYENFQRFPQTVHSQKVVIGSSADLVWA